MTHEEKMKALKEQVAELRSRPCVYPEKEWQIDNYTTDIIDLVDWIFDEEA